VKVGWHDFFNLVKLLRYNCEVCESGVVVAGGRIEGERDVESVEAEEECAYGSYGNAGYAIDGYASVPSDEVYVCEGANDV